MPGTPGAAVDRADWFIWLMLAGRGWGKTRCGAEAVIEIAQRPNQIIALVGATASDVRDTMVKHGILKCSPPWFMPEYMPSQRSLTWPNGSVAITYSAEEPERLRGPNHTFAWCDELAAWRYPEAFAQLRMTLRAGGDPRCIVTTTPKPTKIIRDLIKDEELVVLTRGSTSANLENMAANFLTTVVKVYQGTRLGRQELEAEILDDVPGALWTYAMIDATRIPHEKRPEMQRIVVAIDPSGTKGHVMETEAGKTNDIGIIVAGRGVDGHAYVLEDLTINASPAVWGQRAVDAYNRHRADAIVGETNFGGAMVEHVIRTQRGSNNVRYKGVVASRGKVVRAEPIAGMYESTPNLMAVVHHVGTLPSLETQMSQMTSLGYVGDGSPDRVDALVWALTELMIAPRRAPAAQVGHASYTR